MSGHTDGTFAGGHGDPNALKDPAGLDAETWRRMSIVLERLAASSDLPEILGLVIDSMRDCLHADRASVFQFDPKTQELFISQAHGGVQIRFPLTRGIAGEAGAKRAIINVPDCYADPRFNPEIDKKTGYRTRNMLTIPLIAFDGTLQGVAQVLNKQEKLGAAFDAHDEVVARALASQAAIAMRRAQSIVAERRKQKIEADLVVAKNIQQSAWPKNVPQVPGYSIAARSIPAEETGGDAFDVIDLNSLPADSDQGTRITTGSHPGVMFILGDATGHGIGPALSAQQFRAMVRMGARLGASVERISKYLNAQLCDDLPPGRFVTAFIAHLCPSQHHIRYDSMGQAPLVLVRADGQIEDRAANGMPMGIDPDMIPDAVEPFRLARGDVFLLLSDGYYEAMDPSGEQFGTERAVAAVRANLSRPAVEILAAIDAAVADFAKGVPYGDDQTAILIRRNP